MNALTRPVVVVVGSCWLDGDDADPPTLELRLSNGSYVKVGFDVDYWHRLLWFAPNRSADYQSATGAMTGLDPDVLNSYCNATEDAARCHESNLRSEWNADAMSHGDGQ